MSNLTPIIVRLTQDARARLEEGGRGVHGGLTYALKKFLVRAETVALRGDSKARDIDMCFRLPRETIEHLDMVAKARSCSRTTLINSCITSTAVK